MPKFLLKKEICDFWTFHKGAKMGNKKLNITTVVITSLILLNIFNTSAFTTVWTR